MEAASTVTCPDDELNNSSDLQGVKARLTKAHVVSALLRCIWTSHALPIKLKSVMLVALVRPIAWGRDLAPTAKPGAALEYCGNEQALPFHWCLLA